MTLYDYMKMHGEDYDVYDNEFDNCVTVCLITDREVDKSDSYDVFCNAIVKKVDFVSKSKSEVAIIADWSGLIARNLDKFRAFSAEHWWVQYEDDNEEFIYQWISEINSYMAGYTNESVYKELVKLVNDLI